jgi:hypothetical protein
MISRHHLGLGLVLAVAPLLHAQQEGATAAPAAASTAQDPDRPRQSPAERITELTSERDRLLHEIAFVQSKVATSRQTLIEKFRVRGLEVRSIDAGTTTVTAVAAPVTPTQRQARLMTPKELQAFGADVLMTVNGRPVSYAALDQMLAYLKGFPASGDDSTRQQRAMLELIRLESTLAAFPESALAAEQQVQEALKRLQDGTEFGEVARQYSRGPLQEEGKIKVTRNCPFGLAVEMAAFATEAGKLSATIQGYTGYVLLKVDSATKGANPDGAANADLDVVDAHMILVPYHPDPAEIDQVRNRAIMGPIEIAVRDDDAFKKLPTLYQAMSPQKVPEKDDKKIEAADSGKQEEPKKVEKVEEAAKKPTGQD